MNEQAPLRGLKILGKIDLGTPDIKRDVPKAETYLPQLRASLSAMAADLSSRYGDHFTADGQMKMSGPELADDEKFITERIAYWSNTEDENAADYLENRKKWHQDREKNLSNIAEIATTLLFNKILGEDFIIVRASTYDDYKNGADQLIIDKKTGAVICGLDDVIGSNGDDGAQKKDEKIRQKMKSGGTAIKYGATVDEGKLIRRELSHIPLFYFSLSKKELGGLLESLTVNRDKPDLSRTELEVYTKLLNSLSQQSAGYSSDKTLHPRLQENLRSFEPSLEKMLAHSKSN